MMSARSRNRLTFVLSILCVFLLCFSNAGAQRDAKVPAEKQPGKIEKEEVAKGKTLYSRHCEICHYAQAEALKMAPGMKGIYKKGKYSDGKKVDDASMRLWIEKGGPKMPPFRDTLNDQQVAALIAYIRTL